MAPEVRIAHHPIGPEHPCFVIAEIGVNHNGDEKLAVELIDVAAEAGAQAVKFQTFDPAALAAPTAAKAAYQRDGSDESQLDMLQRLALDDAAHRRLAAHAARRELVFLSTPFDAGSADLLAALGVPAIKLGSGEITNTPLLRHVAGLARPVILSTGMATLGEVETAVATVTARPDSAEPLPLVLLHCVSSYPARAEDCNLLAMELLRERFRVPVGWSDHTEGIAVAIAAVALGADVIEKHITLSRDLPGPDHRASIEPDELAAMIAGIQAARVAVGRAEKTPAASEREIAAVARRSLHWRRDLPGDHVITADDLAALRPGTGIAPTEMDRIIGQTLRTAARAGTMVTEDDLA